MEGNAPVTVSHLFCGPTYSNFHKGSQKGVGLLLNSYPADTADKVTDTKYTPLVLHTHNCTKIHAFQQEYV